MTSVNGTAAVDPLYGLRVDESAAPIIIMTYPRIASIEGVEALFANYRRIAEKYTRVAWVIDMRRFNALMVTVSLRHAFAENYKKSRFTIEAATICEARVYSTAVMRGIDTAVGWILKWPYTIKTFADIGPAVVWAREEVGADVRRRVGIDAVSQR